MRRRALWLLLGGAAAAVACPTLRAQSSEGMRRIGVVMQIAQTDPEARARLAALYDGLRQFGWEIGKNLVVEYRAATDPKEVPERISDVLSSRPEVVLAVPAFNAVELQKQSPSTPVIFVNIGDPVRAGLVDTIARPGRNVTGFTLLARADELIE